MVNIIMLEEKYGQLCDTVYYVSALQFLALEIIGLLYNYVCVLLFLDL